MRRYLNAETATLHGSVAARFARALAITPLLASIVFFSGCGLFYENRLERDECTLFSDIDSKQLRPVGTTVARTMTAYWELFATDVKAVPPPNVVYAEPTRSQRKIFTRELRQEGYYLPILNLVHLSPQIEDQGDHNRKTVILHELCHHFLVCLYPRTASQYWLNEGMACALELSFFQGGSLETPLYHPTLHRHARQALFELGSTKIKEELSNLVDGSWFHFHRSHDKTRHYALSWALVYTLLQPQQQLDWSQRLHSVLHFDAVDLEAQFDKVLQLLRLSPSLELDRLAAKSRTTHWALEQWLTLDHPLDDRLQSRLLPLLNHPELQERCFALALLTRALNQRIHRLSYEKVRVLRQCVAERLQHGCDTERLVIAQNLQEGGRHSSYFPILIELLEWQDPAVRSAAAQALSRISPHPTITSPQFWMYAAESERRAEVASWHRWLHSQQLAQRPTP